MALELLELLALGFEVFDLGFDLFICTGFNRADLLAIRPEGQGDVTETNIAWRTTKGAPLTPSLLLIGEELYAVSDSGLASCWDAKTGTVHWQEKVDGNYVPMPILGPDLIDVRRNAEIRDIAATKEGG